MKRSPFEQELAIIGTCMPLENISKLSMRLSIPYPVLKTRLEKLVRNGLLKEFVGEKVKGRRRHTYRKYEATPRGMQTWLKYLEVKQLLDGEHYIGGKGNGARRLVK